jgi:hypothetical protein
MARSAWAPLYGQQFHYCCPYIYWKYGIDKEIGAIFDKTAGVRLRDPQTSKNACIQHRYAGKRLRTKFAQLAKDDPAQAAAMHSRNDTARSRIVSSCSSAGIVRNAGRHSHRFILYILCDQPRTGDY